MKLIRAVLLAIALGAAAPVYAGDICTKSPKPLAVNYPAGGAVSVSYQVCISGLTHPSIYWDSSLTYSNVSFDGSYQINGTVDLRLNWASNTIGSLVFNNGPLTFTVGGKPYAVVFNDLAFEFDDRFQLQKTTGSLTINGLTVAADSAYLTYLLR